ncbi:MAG: hypothetical protein Q4B43_06325, partial [Bacteroidota bacterium]|nr:hypothetical protein [Bacteroidota bacterium]
SIERENKIIVEKSKSYLESQLTKLNGTDSKVGALKNVLWNEPDFISKNSINHDANNFTVAYPLKDSDTLFLGRLLFKSVNGEIKGKYFVFDFSNTGQKDNYTDLKKMKMHDLLRKYTGLNLSIYGLENNLSLQ